MLSDDFFEWDSLANQAEREYEQYMAQKEPNTELSAENHPRLENTSYRDRDEKSFFDTQLDSLDNRYLELQGDFNKNLVVKGRLPARSCSVTVKEVDPVCCQNCRSPKATLWRKVGKDTYCNACALYYKLHKKRRPDYLIAKGIRRRNRKNPQP